MADFILGRDTKTQGVDVGQVFIEGEECEFIFGRGSQLFPNIPVPVYGTTESRMTLDAVAHWFEFGFRIDAALTGNAGAGWTDAGNYVRLEIQYSTDLVNWSMGKFLPAPVPVVDLGSGVFEYWGRCTVPEHWEDIMIDLAATSDRYGKTITAISVFRSFITLPNFPYDMPSEAGQLQTDLRAAGYAGATVTSVAAPLVASAKNHTVNGTANFVLTQVGTNVTAVSLGGSPVSLPGFPYSMPTQRAALQAALVTAGYSGAVVMLAADTWEIFLPDRIADGTNREFSLTISPSDPFPYWNFYGNYQGLNPNNIIQGISFNVRTPAGEPLQEANRAFARLKISAGNRYDPYL
jgi:hypothetical protein